MTDKVQKIREEVVRMHNLLPVVDGDNIYLNYADRICTTLEMYIDSMHDEPANEIDFEQELYKAFGQVKDFTLGLQIAKRFYDMGKNSQEPVSEELKQSAITAADEDMQGRQIMEESNENRQLYSRIFRRGFKVGANWQKQKTIKKACEWLDKNTVKYIITKPVHETKMTGLGVSMVDDFKEAMEG